MNQQPFIKLVELDICQFVKVVNELKAGLAISYVTCFLLPLIYYKGRLFYS